MFDILFVNKNWPVDNKYRHAYLSMINQINQ